MINKIKKISTCLAAVRSDVKAFTLTEVMIGMMILTVAIVSASNLLTGIIDSNRNNLTTLQAYYLSQEGLEMVRNIRDTNWLHNRDWLGKQGEVWGEKFEIPAAGKEDVYYVNMVDAPGTKSFALPDKIGPIIGDVSNEKPWGINVSGDGKIYRHINPGGAYMDSSGTSKEETGFKRTIILKKYDCNYLPVGLCADGKYVLVQSKVEWDIGAKHRDLFLSEVLTNWKGGAL